MKRVSPFALLVLVVCACGQWDRGPKAPEPPPAPTPGPKNTRSAELEKVIQEFAKFCVVSQVVPSDSEEISVSIIRAFTTKDTPSFKTRQEQCEWAAEEACKAKSLNMGVLKTLKSAPDLKPIAALTCLETLSLKNNNIDFRALEVLKPLEKLENLDLTGNPSLEEDDMEKRIRELFPKLKNLELDEDEPEKPRMI